MPRCIQSGGAMEQARIDIPRSPKRCQPRSPAKNIEKSHPLGWLFSAARGSRRAQLMSLRGMVRLGGQQKMDPVQFGYALGL